MWSIRSSSARRWSADPANGSMGGSYACGSGPISVRHSDCDQRNAGIALRADVDRQGAMAVDHAAMSFGDLDRPTIRARFDLQRDHFLAQVMHGFRIEA